MSDGSDGSDGSDKEYDFGELEALDKDLVGKLAAADAERAAEQASEDAEADKKRSSGRKIAGLYDWAGGFESKSGKEFYVLLSDKARVSALTNIWLFQVISKYLVDIILLDWGGREVFGDEPSPRAAMDENVLIRRAYYKTYYALLGSDRTVTERKSLFNDPIDQFDLNLLLKIKLNEMDQAIDNIDTSSPVWTLESVHKKYPRINKSWVQSYGNRVSLKNAAFDSSKIFKDLRTFRNKIAHLSAGFTSTDKDWAELFDAGGLADQFAAFLASGSRRGYVALHRRYVDELDAFRRRLVSDMAQARTTAFA